MKKRESNNSYTVRQFNNEPSIYQKESVQDNKVKTISTKSLAGKNVATNFTSIQITKRDGLVSKLKERLITIN